MTPNERHYVRAVEAAWSQTLGKAVVVSPREFEAIDGWRRRGIPLAVVLEVIATVAKRRSGRAPRSITTLTKDVLEAWSVIASGRAAPEAADPRPTRSDARRAWRDALDRFPTDDRLHALLSTLLAQEAEGRPPSSIDAALDEALPDSVPDGLLHRVTEQTERDLAQFRQRMQDAEFRRMLARARADRLRSELKLPRLELTR